MSKLYEDQIHRALGVFEHKNNVREHFYCVKQILELHSSKEQVKALLARPDLDTVCAFDYHQMKSNALSAGGLSYKDWHPEAQGIKVPELHEH